MVYEDQGGPIRLQPGDCVIQPPEIRHRVLAASDGLQVIEVGVPAEHVTEIDHVMILPCNKKNSDRVWQNQRFVHSEANKSIWEAGRLPGLLRRDTGICENTKGVAAVHVIRKEKEKIFVPVWHQHKSDIFFTFVMNGTVSLQLEGKMESFSLQSGDAFVIPPDMKVKYFDPSEDVELLEVFLPGHFETIIANKEK